MVTLDVRKVPGAIMIDIFAVAIAGILLGVNKFDGIVSLPPSIAPAFLKMDIAAAPEVGVITIVLTFVFVDVFDHTGTLAAIAHSD